ncbi:RNA polymerase II transcription elongation factor-domain-containing protein [Irpex lacteus]|nr:RNA polymerase II transcription elongation factor-domain-containing protein [Irpex lacteus]
MASASSSPWMPTTGRYPAKVGKSLARVIKARKGEPLQKSKFPEPDFYSLRYNFIPPSVDSRKPGTIEVRKGQDTTSVTVERANSQTEEGGHIFVGAETTAKEVECVLIYDEVLQSFTLEKLDSYVNLTYDRKTAKAPRHTGSRRFEYSRHVIYTDTFST